PNVAVRPSSSRVQVEDASGTGAETTAMPPQGRSPETSEVSTGTPDVVYLPIVPLPTFTTNRLSPRTSIPTGKFNPSMSAGFTGTPEVVYSPTVPPYALVTNKFPSDTAMSTGKS